MSPRLPEPPRHRLIITTADEPIERYVSSGHPKIGDHTAHRQRTIVRCGVCGHDTEESAEYLAWLGHEHHFDARHVGQKSVWRAEDVATETLADVSRWSRYSFRRDDDTPDVVGSYRGDTPDEFLRERLDAHVTYLVVHQPPGTPYPDSPEEHATESLYVLVGDGGDE